MGPLNGLRFRFAKTRPGDDGGTGFALPNAALDSLRPRGKPERTRRMLLGKVEDVGVAGSTFMLLCGDLLSLWEWPEMETAGEAMLADEVDDALLCEWWWWGIERTDDTDDDVDLRPRRPPEERR
jgi:hypothetical protein